jgi:ABC-type sugar transport system ATPase subunit
MNTLLDDGSPSPDAAPPSAGLPTGDALLEVRGVVKRFPGVLALRGVSFAVARGEIHALLGENGAGKSTIIKVLSGAYQPDEGEVRLRGSTVHLSSPQDARDLGISTIHQEMTLVPHLSALRNIFLAREPRRRFAGLQLGLLDEAAMREQVLPLCKRFNFDPADLDRPVSEFGALKKHVLEIIKSLAFEADLVIMDEPTAALTDHERDALFADMRTLRDAGISVLWVTHRLEELAGLADRATVLRDGGFVDTVAVDAVDTQALVRMMLGRAVDGVGSFVAEAVADIEHHVEADEVLRVESISRRPVLDDISFSLRRGEVLGIAGLAGAGRTELARAIVGADRIDTGTVYVEGQRVKIKQPRDAVRAGIALAPEERKVQAVFADLSVAQNIALGSMSEIMKGRVVVDRAAEARVAERYVEDMGIRTPSIRQKAGLLSGGNQQKTVVARCLFAAPKVLIFDEPTQGVDIGAKAEIHRLIREYVSAGGAAIVISSETPELLTIADRVVVMRQGRLAGELPGCRPGADEQELQAKEEEIMGLATGGNLDA